MIKEKTLGPSNVPSISLLKPVGIFASVFAIFAMLLMASRAPGMDNLRSSATVSEVASQDDADLQDCWKRHVDLTEKVANDFSNNLKSLKNSADKAKDQIDEWAATQVAKNSGQIKEYVHQLSSASITLLNVETDFKIWCKTQSRTYKSIAHLAKLRFSKHAKTENVNLKVEVELLRRATGKGEKEIAAMQKKVETSQVAFSTLAAKVAKLRKDIVKQKDDLKTKVTQNILKVATAIPIYGWGFHATFPQVKKWANRFIDAEKTVKELLRIALELKAKAKEDYNTLTKVRSRLQVISTFTINDPTLFRDETLPRMASLCVILDKIIGTDMGFGKIFSK